MERTFLRDEMNGSMSGMEDVKIGGDISDSCKILDIGAVTKESLIWSAQRLRLYKDEPRDL